MTSQQHHNARHKSLLHSLQLVLKIKYVEFEDDPKVKHLYKNLRM